MRKICFKKSPLKLIGKKQYKKIVWTYNLQKKTEMAYKHGKDAPTPLIIRKIQPNKFMV